MCYCWEEGVRVCVCAMLLAINDRVLRTQIASHGSHVHSTGDWLQGFPLFHKDSEAGVDTEAGGRSVPLRASAPLFLHL